MRLRRHMTTRLNIQHPSFSKRLRRVGLKRRRDAMVLRGARGKRTCDGWGMMGNGCLGRGQRLRDWAYERREKYCRRTTRLTGAEEEMNELGVHFNGLGD